MKKIMFILQMLAPYFFIGIKLYTGCAIGTEKTALLEQMDKSAFYVLLIICLCNMIYPFVFRREFQAGELLFWSMLIKIASIPFYLLVFAVGIFAVATIRGVIALPILGLLDYLILLPSSMIALNGFYLQKKEKQIKSLQCLFLCILEFLFCCDLFATIYGYCKSKKD